MKLRDQQRLAHGPLREYPQYPNGTFGDAAPRSGNASGGGQLGWVVKTRGWESDPNAYIYVIAQAAAFPALAKAIGREDWLDDSEWNTPEARLPKLDRMFAEIERWTMTRDKFEVMGVLNPLNVPCGPILSMKELAEESSLRATGTVVEVDHPTCGPYLTVGNPVKLSASPSEVQRSPCSASTPSRSCARSWATPSKRSRRRGKRAPSAARTWRSRRPESQNTLALAWEKVESAPGPQDAGSRYGVGVGRRAAYIDMITPQGPTPWLPRTAATHPPVRPQSDGTGFVPLRAIRRQSR